MKAFLFIFPNVCNKEKNCRVCFAKDIVPVVSDNCRSVNGLISSVVLFYRHAVKCVIRKNAQIDTEGQGLQCVDDDDDDCCCC